MNFLPLENSDHVVFLVSTEFPSNSKGVPFHPTAYGYSHANWQSLYDHLRVVPWKDIIKLCVSAAATEFCE